MLKIVIERLDGVARIFCTGWTRDGDLPLEAAFECEDVTIKTKYYKVSDFGAIYYKEVE